jgi:hypothetical protein
MPPPPFADHPADSRFVSYCADTAPDHAPHLPLPVAALFIGTASLGLWVLIWKLATHLLAW